MGRAWRQDFESGTTPIACSICGMRCRFPDEIGISADKLFRCFAKCQEKTAYEVDQELAAFRTRREQPDTSLGIRPTYDPGGSDFFVAAKARMGTLLGADFSPSRVFFEDFDLDPSFAGFGWAKFATAGITQPEESVIRIDDTGAGRRIWRPDFPVPSVSGSFYASFRIKVRDQSGTVLMRPGVATLIGGAVTSNSVIAMAGGYLSTSSTTHFTHVFAGGSVTTSSVAVDAEWHTCELWWTGNGLVNGAIDFGSTASATPSASLVPPMVPFFQVSGATGNLDIDKAVYFS